MIRENIVEEVKRILLGPIDGNEEELHKNPLDLYSVGILFPQLNKTRDYSSQVPDISDISENTNENRSDEIEFHSENYSIRRRRVAAESDESDTSEEFELTTKFRPSAAGISVISSRNGTLRIDIDFATYTKKQIDKIVGEGNEQRIIKITAYKHLLHKYSIERKEGKFFYNNNPLEEVGNFIEIDLDVDAYLSISVRPYFESLEIITITIINKNIATSFGNQKKAEDCLFQPIINIYHENGFYPFEDQTDLSKLSKEDLNLKLLYRNYKIYGLGHGISVNWDSSEGSVHNVFTQVLPTENINGVNFDPKLFGESNVLFIKKLSGKSIDDTYNWESIKNELYYFITKYTEWINNNEDLINNNSLGLDSPELIDQARQNLAQCKKLYERMDEGIKILASNSIARKAFEDSNCAMFMQRAMGDFSKHRRKTKRVQHNDSIYDDALPEYRHIPFDAYEERIWEDGKLINDHNKKAGKFLARWRPFQLAFLLSQVKGIVDDESEDRDTVDLIWFPTGGGKTEAYLGLTAFAIFYRRLKAKQTSNNPDDGAGVTVLMRYTLRLLNKQQFERASILICACDLIRRSDQNNYGKSRISNGIWMGRSMTPNNENDQRDDYQDYFRQIDYGRKPDVFKNSPPLLSCPCCGNRLVKEISKNGVIGRWGYFRAKDLRNREIGRYLIACTNTKCDFHATSKTLKEYSFKLLPIYEVDETIYNERPSLLFSTVDKFVQLAWRSESFNLFNIEFSSGEINRIYPSPELIIQDELHLISSALGTIYGVYEIVIERLFREKEKRISKIIGASATVRNSEEQCKRLYGRKHFLQFPPPALNADDSFYTQKIKDFDPKNRLYVGFMPSGITTSTALIRLTSVLLERIPTFVNSNEEVDNYYTLVVYFNALKELGKFRTFLADDIVAYRKLIANHYNTFIKPYNDFAICELSSVMTADDITSGLDRLEKTTLPRDLDINNPLVRKLFETGIRKYSDIKTAKGPVWNSVFINESFFNIINLPYSGENDRDYKTFINAVEDLMQDKQEPVQIAPATNMISVGVDIPRLNTMIINGQPKTSAEYIQASSRIGREIPGVVFTFLAPTKNRDRSHYEQFKAFHQAYYYYVESNSVTPFSGPALEKVLPTVLIALTRSLYLYGNPGIFPANDNSYLAFIDEITDEIKKRGIEIYGQEYYAEISNNVNIIKKDFIGRLKLLHGNRKLATYQNFMNWDPLTGRIVTAINNPQAVYNAPGQFVESILHDHIPTMQTLRNVESSSKVSIKSH